MPHDFEIKMIHHNSVTKIPICPVIVGLAIERERGGWVGGQDHLYFSYTHYNTTYVFDK